MAWGAIDILTAARLPELCRQVCAYAGLPAGPLPPPADRFVFRSGYEAPELLPRLLEEAFAEDAAEVQVFREEDRPDWAGLPPGSILVQEGFGDACPLLRQLQEAAGGRGLFFAVERRGPGGELRRVVWAALSDEPADSETPLKAAVSGRSWDGGERGA